MQSRPIGSFLALLAMCFVAACGSDGDRERDEKKLDEPLTPVEATLIERGPISTYEVATGRIEATQNAPVFARVSQVCKEVLVVEGQTVNADDELAILDDDEYAYQRSQQEASLEKANQQVKQAEFEREKALSDYEKVQKEFDDGQQDIYTKTDLANALLAYEKAEIALKVAKQEAKRAEAEFNAADLRLKNTTIRTPIAGIVVKVDVEPYDIVNVDQQLFEVAQLDQLEVDVDVPEANSGTIHSASTNDAGKPDLAQAQAVLLYASAFPDARFLGYVESVAPIVDATRGMVKVTLRVVTPLAPENDGQYEPLLAQFPPPERRLLEESARRFADADPRESLRPGMWVQASIVRDVKEGALLLPSACIVNGAIFVVVPKSDDETAKRKKVKKKGKKAAPSFESESYEVKRIDVLSQRGIRNDRFTELIPTGSDGAYLFSKSWVVLRGQDFLRDGNAVSVVNKSELEALQP